MIQDSVKGINKHYFTICLLKSIRSLAEPVDRASRELLVCLFCRSPQIID
jgi:hypothetical protein